ncbi:hypothetical protein [Chryseobacterium sp. BIGb0232]|uniref:hypothetical protein n=1 Tax=Chryseobacterium sp. BIGb0232 TaxID=2940598 RepID=UPI000F49664B|nr:hypothetical protein [Chryseobacterium sp. BIGb0232]MCS4304582.1 hypothetical protein [Chryseobacterium sp. BIGb0232]ROS14284.1 hypothetical protein EDF65_3055 [Chryseobacterium nakagawai]
MKKLIIHSVPVVISGLWLVTECKTFNPITLKGPDFLKFYLILVLGFYLSVFILKLFAERASQITFYFLILIGGLGIVKLIRGIILGKPVGFLIMILIVELIVILLLTTFPPKDEFRK